MAEMEGDRFIIGRGAECDLVLEDDDVSRRHAAIEREGTHWIIIDLKSTNGVVVDGQRVKRARLGDRSRFRLGDTLLEICDRTAGPGAGRY